MKHIEIEMKYNASVISPDAFNYFCNMKEPMSFAGFSGYDTFYSHPVDTESFFRYREREGEAELTFKRKLSKSDSIIRIEHNLHLLYPSHDKCEGFVFDMGYVRNSVIFKTALVYDFETYCVCYYICYNTNMEELGRFVEIELHEDLEWGSEDEALASLNQIEQQYHNLGLTPLNRLKTSLFEMFRIRS
jgi:adenylate cyclase class IV